MTLFLFFQSFVSFSLDEGDEGRWIGMTGFEPATSCSQNRSATKLRYIPAAVDHPSLVYLFFFSWQAALLAGGDGHLGGTVSCRGGKFERPMES